MFQGEINLNRKSYFNWKDRYAIHQAFHQTLPNQIAHFIATPIQLFSLIKLLALCYLPGLNTGFNVALLFITFLSFTYCLIHIKIGLIVSAYLTVCWYFASYYHFQSQSLDFLLGVTLFFLGILIQVGVGHKLLERKNTNLSSEFEEFFRSYNPMIFILIYFFPFIDFANIISKLRAIPSGK